MRQIVHQPNMELTKRYYSISEVAEMFEMNISKLRFWEEQFPSLKPKRDRAGDRKYTSADIDHVKLLVNLIDTQGYTIEGAKRAIRTKEYKKPQNAEVIKTLEDLKDFLVFLRKGLDNENESDSEESNPDNFLPEEE